MKRSFPGALAVILMAAVSVSGQTFSVESAPSFETYYLDFSGGGARAEGMGKAFLGISDDVTGASWNPAGIIGIEKPRLGFSYGSLMPRGSSTSTVLLQDRTFKNLGKYSGSFAAVTSLNFVAPLRVKGHQFVCSFSFVRNYDDFQRLTLAGEQMVPLLARDKTGTIFLDTLTAFFDVTSQLQGGMNSVNLGFGTPVYQNFSLGVSANIYTGKTVRNQETFDYIDSFTVDQFTWQKALLEERRLYIDTNKFTGFNFTIGFKHKGDRMDAGLVLRTPFSLNVKNGRSVYNYTAINHLPVDQLTDTIFYDNRLIKYSMPLMIGAGVAYRATPNLLVALDAEYRGYSSTRIKFRDSLRLDPGGKNVEFFTEYNALWNDVFLVRLGGEYKWVNRFGTVPLRFGFGYEPLPAPSFQANIDKLDRIPTQKTPVALSFSLGTGIQWSQIHLEWAYTYTRFNQDVTDSYVYAGQLRNRNHHVNFSFTGYF